MARKKKRVETMQYSGFRIDQNQIDRLDPESTSPEYFYKNYVAKRKPCVFIKTWLTENGHNLGKLGDLSYLKEKAGSSQVQVEKKYNGSFGSGQERSLMSFESFLGELNLKPDVYLTTQYSHDLEYLQKPLDKLTDAFPKRPFLLPTLVPQQVNLWIGAAQEYTSSGLHHDFAENLYVLVKGNKRFTLFDPSQAYLLYTQQEPVKIHENGYISYSNFTRSDGADLRDVLDHRIRVAEQKIEQGIDAEDELDQAMDEMLELESKTDPESNGDPPSFSRIRPELLQTTSSDEFPLLKKAKRITVDLIQGEMLYLPVGWFHEVRSRGLDDPVHIAFNYWFHPPVTNSFKNPYQDDFWNEKWTELNFT